MQYRMFGIDLMSFLYTDHTTLYNIPFLLLLWPYKKNVIPSVYFGILSVNLRQEQTHEYITSLAIHIRKEINT